MTAVYLMAALFLPVVAAIIIRFLPTRLERWPRRIALVTVVATLVFTGLVVQDCRLVAASEQVQAGAGFFPETAIILPWFAVGNLLGDEATEYVYFRLGLDGISLWLFAMVPLLMLVSVLLGWNRMQNRAHGYYALLMILQTGMVGVFAAGDLILFYIFFEATLIPLFLLVGSWGEGDRQRAAIKFFLYTFTGSVLTFLGLLGVVIWNFQATGNLTFSIAELTESVRTGDMPFAWQFWIYLGLFAGFAVKVPLFPFHTWLPTAYVAAPTPVTLLLSGLLAKIGTYGFVRFNLAMLPEASRGALPWLVPLAVVSIIYGALLALAQRDFKRMIAYSSFSHLGFCLLGIFSMNTPGLDGAVVYMLAHGLSAAGLFAMVGILEERFEVREMNIYGGLALRFPAMCLFMVTLAMASVGLPGLSGFVGEFLVLLGGFQQIWATPGVQVTVALRVWAVLAPLGVLLGAWYMLSLVQQVFFGPLQEPKRPEPSHIDRATGDLTFRELLALSPLVLFIFWLGLAPQYYMAPISTSTRPILQMYQPESTVGPRQQTAQAEPAVGPEPAESDVAAVDPGVAPKSPALATTLGETRVD